ncbi:MAG: DNA-primase RepB domain-containing protein [Acidobacteriota bacterium]|nr:DNA-primase RepB domain-containing protein [Acidobacteriota bacterium]
MLTWPESSVLCGLRGAQRTREAVRRQIQAMGLSCNELGIHQPDQRMILRTWSCDQILASIPWLRHMNAVGAHIYLRPTASRGLVLLDDIDLSTITRLRADGLPPAAVVETSPDNYQCWIRLIHNREQRDIPKDLVRQLLRRLAAHYHADPCSADWRHFGRLAGFTNQKPCYASTNGQPFVLLRFAVPVVAPEGRSALLRARLLKRRDEQPRKAALPLRPHTYTQRLRRILTINRRQPWSHSPDYSRIDFMIAREMLTEGHDTDVVERAILEGSPDLNTRKHGHIQDYVHRTVLAAASTLPLSPSRHLNQSVNKGSPQTG